jgi:hypothetical protein
VDPQEDIIMAGQAGAGMETAHEISMMPRISNG